MGRTQADPIVLAKLTRPAARGVLPRERLFAALDAAPVGSEGGAVWVSGPAGSGKTTLVASYLEARGLPHLWFRLDEADGDPATFFHYLGLGARRAAPRRRKPLPLLTPEYLPGLSIFARGYLREMYGRLKAPFVVVFDNHQELPPDSPVQAVLRTALEELPPGGRVVIVSRDVPGPGFAAQVAAGRLVPVGSEDLAFTPGEAEDLLRLWGVTAPGAADRLQARTGGWVAGMVLMRGQAEAPGPQATPDTVDAFFTGQLLEGAEAPVRRFLAAIAVLPETTAPMARALTGEADADRILADLARRNFFVDRHPGPEPVYTLHALFREFLLGWGARNLGAAALNDLRREGARVLAEAGQEAEAVELLAAAGAWDALGQLVAGAAPRLAAQARFGTLVEWLNLLPGDRLARNPGLLFWHGVGLLAANPDAARPSLEAAWDLFKTAGDRNGCLMVWPAIVDTYQYAWGDFHPLSRWIAELEALLGPEPAFPSPEVEARVAVGMVNALFLHRPDHPARKAWEARLERLMELVPDPGQRLLIGARLAQGLSTLGEFRRGERLLTALAPDLKSPGATPLAVITFRVVRAVYGWITGHPEACRRDVEAALALGHETGVLVCDYIAMAQGTYGRLTAGDMAGAADLLERMRPLLVPSRRVDSALFHYLCTWKALLEGDLPAARDHARTSLRHGAEAGMPLAEGLARLALAHTLFELGERREAREHLEGVFETARAMGSEHMRFMALLTQAHFALGDGDGPAADAALGTALALGREQGFTNFACWLPVVMARLCARALAAGIETDSVRELIRFRDLSPPDPAPAAEDGWAWPVTVHALGGFRVAVDGAPVGFSRKTQKRPLALLAALVAAGPEGAAEHRVADALWPEAGGDAAQNALGTTVHRLRQLLGQEGAVRRTGGRIALDGAVCWVDAWAFEALLAQGEDGGGPEHTDQSLHLYRGPALPEADLPDAVPFRERLREKFVRHSLARGAALEAAGASGPACARYLKSIEAEPAAEPLYLALMRCRAATGRTAEAAAAYQRLRQTLGSTLGEPPSAEARALYDRLRDRPAPPPPGPDPANP